MRGGGHNVAGRACVDGGVMIDLSLMRQVDRRSGRRAWRAAGGGALWRDFNRETQQFGLATTGGVVSSTGVAGLTLGGGFGWLMPRFGMALDNLRSATLVLADGSVVRVGRRQHPDLFWAMRGGGGNFGVAATLEFQLHEVGPMVTGGLVAHPGPRAQGRAALLPRAGARSAGRSVPGGGDAHRAGRIRHQDRRRSPRSTRGRCRPARRSRKPIKAFGPPVMDVLGPMPYVASNMMLDDVIPEGRAQLLEVALPARPERRRDRRAGRAVRSAADADEPDCDRALPRRGHPRARRRHRLRAARQRLQRPLRGAVAGSEGRRPLHGRGPRERTRHCSPSSARVAT